MPANITGRSDTNSYNLGRGIVYFSPLATWVDGKPLHWRDMGNSPEFSFSVSAEDLDHNQRRTGLSTVDKSVVLSQSVGLSFTLDELNDENLALVYSGSQATHSNESVRDGFTQIDQPHDLTAILNGASSVTGIVTGRWYDLFDDNGERILDLRNTSTITLRLKGDFGSPVTLVNDTDYVLDRDTGRVFFLSTSTAITRARVVDDNCIFDLTVSATASARDASEVRALTQSAVVGALKFIAENAVDGTRTEYLFHRVSLRANGDVEKIGDTWSVLPFEGTAERYAVVDPDAPVCRIRSIGQSRPQILSANINDGDETIEIVFDQNVYFAELLGAGDIEFNYDENVYTSINGQEIPLVAASSPGVTKAVMPWTDFFSTPGDPGEPLLTVAENLAFRTGSLPGTLGNIGVTDFPAPAI